MNIKGNKTRNQKKIGLFRKQMLKEVDAKFGMPLEKMMLFKHMLVMVIISFLLSFATCVTEFRLHRLTLVTFYRTKCGRFHFYWDPHHIFNRVTVTA